MENIKQFSKDWCLPACFGDPDGILVADFLLGYRAYCEYHGLERLLFTHVLQTLGSSTFVFDRNGSLGPITLRKWKPGVNSYILHVKNTPWTKPNVPTLMKRKQTTDHEDCSPPKRKRSNPEPQKTCPNPEPKMKSQGSFPTLTSYTVCYDGRLSLEWFLRESFTRVESPDENRQAMSCVTLNDFYNNLKDFCCSHHLPLPHPVNCGRQLAYIGIKKAKVGPSPHQQRCYKGLKWKYACDENRRNFSVFSKRKEKRKLQRQKTNKGKFIPNANYKIKFGVELQPTDETQPFSPLLLSFPRKLMDETEEIDIQCSMNCYGTFNVKTKLNLKDLAKKLPNVVEWEAPNSSLHGLLLQLRRPNIKATIYQSGRINVVGPVGENALRIGARRVARLVQKSSSNAQGLVFNSFRINVYKATMILPCSVNPDYDTMLFQHLIFDYHPEIDIIDKISVDIGKRCVTYQDASGTKSATIKVCPNGSLVITANDRNYLYESIRKTATPVMQHYGITRSTAEEELLSLDHMEFGPDHVTTVDIQ